MADGKKPWESTTQSFSPFDVSRVCFQWLEPNFLSCKKNDDSENPGYMRGDYTNNSAPPTPLNMPLPNNWKCLHSAYADEVKPLAPPGAGVDDLASAARDIKRNQRLRGALR